MLSIIVAVAKNNVIGKDNKLVWHLPEDLKRFKKLTTGHAIIMGRKTFESLGRVLPNRKHIVLTNNSNIKIEYENVEVIDDIKLLERYINSEEENFIIGGATIYKLLMPYVQKIYLTLIHKEFEGDVYFPEIKKEEWKIIDREKGLENKDNPFEYEYITFTRKNENIKRNVE